MKRISRIILAAVTVLGLTMTAQAATTAAKPTLTSDDCVKCHAVQPNDIATAGASHKTITCQDCHAGHRPTSKNNIPQCNQCHSGKAHYQLTGCLGCHRNPHTPLKVTFGDKVTDPCLTCHTKQIAQLRENKSKHSALFCSTCHGVHRKVPQCVQCHKPHAPTMVAADCKKCHKAHMPKVVTYGNDLPNKDCAACHKAAYDLLTASSAKHKTLACVYCHQGKHKTVPACQSCHGTPHPAGMLARFPKCGTCHNIAHDLNNWSAAPAGAAEHKKGAVAPKKK
jgi:hypothetical protein